jgi:hypothetical protein
MESDIMNWNETYSQNKQPKLKEIEKFINNPLWNELNKFIQDIYAVEPELSYSVCAAQPRLEC